MHLREQPARRAAVAFNDGIGGRPGIKRYRGNERKRGKEGLTEDEKREREKEIRQVESSGIGSSEAPASSRLMHLLTKRLACCRIFAPRCIVRSFIAQKSITNSGNRTQPLPNLPAMMPSFVFSRVYRNVKIFRYVGYWTSELWESPCF